MPSLNINKFLIVERANNQYIYYMMTVLICGLAVAVFIGFVLRQIRASRATAKWTEINKDKPTTKANINNVAQLADLTAEEKHILEHTCKKFTPRNIEYILRDEAKIKELFKQEYSDLIANHAKEEKIALFFEMLYKIERAHDNITMITNAKAIPLGQKLTYLDAERRLWTLTLERINEQGFIIAIPTSFMENEIKPAPLAKFVLTFKTEAGTSYALLTRVVRYEEEKTGKFILVASANSTLTAAQRRASKRRHTETACKFSSVKIVSTSKTPNYEIAEKKYDGKLENVSTGGCRFSCKIPIKQGQYLNLEFNLGERGPYQAIGYIVMTTKSPDGKDYILHVKFVDIDISVKNKISSFIYDYDN